MKTNRLRAAFRAAEALKNLAEFLSIYSDEQYGDTRLIDELNKADHALQSAIGEFRPKGQARTASFCGSLLTAIRRVRQ